MTIAATRNSIAANATIACIAAAARVNGPLDAAKAQWIVPGCAVAPGASERLAMAAPGINIGFNAQRFAANAGTWVAEAAGGGESGASGASSDAGDAAGAAGGGGGRGRGPTKQELADLRAWLSSPRDFNTFDNKFSEYPWGQDPSALIATFIPLLRDPDNIVRGNASLFLYLSVGGLLLECGRHYQGDVFDASRLELSVRTLQEVLRAIADGREKGRQLQPDSIRLQTYIIREYTEFVLSDDDEEVEELSKLRAWMRAVFERVEHDDDAAIRNEMQRVRARAIVIREYDAASNDEGIPDPFERTHENHCREIERIYGPRGLATAAFSKFGMATHLWEILKDRPSWPEVSDQEISLLAGIYLLGIAAFSPPFMTMHLASHGKSHLITLAKLARLDSPECLTPEEIDAFTAGMAETLFREAVSMAIHIAQCPTCERAYQEALRRRN